MINLLLLIFKQNFHPLYAFLSQVKFTWILKSRKKIIVLAKVDCIGKHTIHYRQHYLRFYSLRASDLLFFIRFLPLKQWYWFQFLRRSRTKTPIFYFNSLQKYLLRSLHRLRLVCSLNLSHIFCIFFGVCFVICLDFIYWDFEKFSYFIYLFICPRWYVYNLGSLYCSSSFGRLLYGFLGIVWNGGLCEICCYGCVMTLIFSLIHFIQGT